MYERELIMQELWSRMASVTGVKFTARNPEVAPGADDMPVIQFFELDDTVLEATRRGAAGVIYKRRLMVVIEVFIKPATESGASAELTAFMQQVKKKLYAGGPSLGGRCSFQETEAGRVLRPPAGEHLIGVGLAISIVYLEDISKIL